MPWVIGIDEAGYGPNLGPLVQAAALARLPDADIAGWVTFRQRVRRAGEPGDARILVDDSKKVHASGGLPALARSLAGWCGGLAEIVRTAGVLDSHELFDAEYHSRLACDAELSHTPCPIAAAGVRPTCINLVVPARLNRVIDDTGSKAPALLRGYAALVQAAMQTLADDGERAIIVTDKLGGRHYYAPLLQETFPQGWVVAECETPAESRYRIENLARPVSAIFRPKADAGSIGVALASMMAKYVRELCMREFNAFWSERVPGLKPTAGYPVDAKRYYREIESEMQKLGLAADTIWRKK